MNLNLDLNKCGLLRNKINEHIAFIKDIKYSVIINEKAKAEVKAKAKETSVFDCICAIMDRIDSTSDYLNEFEMSENPLEFSNFIHHSSVLIDCIKELSKIFEKEQEINNFIFKKDKVNDDKSDFEKDEVNDDKYFQYLRSICSAHPVTTNRHKNFQNSEFEWCPYLRWGSPLFSDEHSDLTAKVYTSNEIKEIPIYLNQVYEYVKFKFDYIDKIINVIDKHYNKKIDELKEDIIPSKESFEKYTEYLESLQLAIKARWDEEGFHSMDYVIKVFETTFEDKDFNEILNNYKNDLKYAIEKLYNQLQSMEYIDGSLIPDELSFLCHINPRGSIGYTYSYQLQKIMYLWFDKATDESLKEVESSVEMYKTNFSKFKLKRSLIVYEKYILNNPEASPKESLHFFSNLDSQVEFNNVEWARVNIKIMENFFNKYLPKSIDLYASDWKIYLLCNLGLYNYSLIKERKPEKNA